MKTIHELEKMKKGLDMEKSEIQAALEEVEVNNLKKSLTLSGCCGIFFLTARIPVSINHHSVCLRAPWSTRKAKLSASSLNLTRLSLRLTGSWRRRTRSSTTFGEICSFLIRSATPVNYIFLILLSATLLAATIRERWSPCRPPWTPRPRLATRRCA